MKIVDITSVDEMIDAVEFIQEQGYTIFDLETESLKFQSDILSIQLKQGDICYYIALDSIPRLRCEKPHKIAKKNKPTQAAPKQQVKQFALFDLDAYTVDIARGMDDIEDMFGPQIGLPVQQETTAPDSYQSAFIQLEMIIPHLMAIFGDPTIKKIAHNIKFDAKFLLYRDIPVRNWYFDTMLAAWQIKEDRLRYGLKELYQEQTGIESLTFKQTVGDKYYWELTDERMRYYSCGDVEKTEYLWKLYEPQVIEEGWAFFESQMMRVCETTAHMEMSGFYVDQEYAHGKVAEYTAIMEEKAAGILDSVDKLSDEKGFIVPAGFSITSSQKLAILFYDLIGYKVGEKRTVDKHILKKWADKGDLIAKELLEYREVEALNKFIDGSKNAGILSNINEDGRVYPTFNQHRTVIHRYSGSNPNFQNFPRKVNGVRECFRAAPGRRLFIADYSQIELRCAAFYSRDPHYLSAYCSDDKVDIHELTRRSIVALAFPDLNGVEQRTLAKNVNFGITYGAGIRAIMDTLNCGKQQAQLIITEYRDYYHVYTDWVARVHSWVEDKHWVGNKYGGSRRFSIAEGSKWEDMAEWKQAFIKREAVHFIVSSTASCIIKARMNLIDDMIWDNPDLDIKMVSQVHDELIFEIPIDYDATPIKDIMESPDNVFDIPLVVDCDYKDVWTK